MIVYFALLMNVKFHDGGVNYCTLEEIQVMKHEPEAKTVECTDCGSFAK